MTLPILNSGWYHSLTETDPALVAAPAVAQVSADDTFVRAHSIYRTDISPFGTILTSPMVSDKREIASSTWSGRMAAMEQSLSETRSQMEALLQSHRELVSLLLTLVDQLKSKPVDKEAIPLNALRSPRQEVGLRSFI